MQYAPCSPSETSQIGQIRRSYFGIQCEWRRSWRGKSSSLFMPLLWRGINLPLPRLVPLAWSTCIWYEQTRLLLLFVQESRLKDVISEWKNCPCRVSQQLNFINRRLVMWKPKEIKYIEPALLDYWCRENVVVILNRWSYGRIIKLDRGRWSHRERIYTEKAKREKHRIAVKKMALIQPLQRHK